PILEDRLAIDLGARYSWDKRHQEATAFFGSVLPAGNSRYSSFDPGITLDYRWTDDIHTYAKAVTAYRAGGFNQTLTTVSSFGPENVTSYEVGLKSVWWDRRVLFNISAFLADYKDIQVGVVLPPTATSNAMLVTRNAGKGTIKAFDTEANFYPFDGLT